MLQTKCGVRQSLATCVFLIHLECLRLGMLEPRLWWNGLGLPLEGLNLDYDLLVFAWNGLGLHLEGLNHNYDLLVLAWMAWPYTSCMHLVSFWHLKVIMRVHLWWAQVLGLDSFKKQIGLPSLLDFWV